MDSKKIRASSLVAYGRETQPLGQSRISRLGLTVLAPLAWLLGYRAHYPRYCTRLDGASLIAQAEQQVS